MGFLRSDDGAALADLISVAQAEPATDLAIIEIIRRFEPLVSRIGYRLAGNQSFREDVQNAARLGLAQAVQRHSGAVDGFPTYAKRYMTGAANRELARWLPPPEVVFTTLDAVAPCIEGTSPSVEAFLEGDGWGHGETATAIRSLPIAQQQLLYRRYVDDAGLNELARDSDTTPAAVSQRLGTAHRRLRYLLAA